MDSAHQPHFRGIKFCALTFHLSLFFIRRSLAKEDTFHSWYYFMLPFTPVFFQLRVFAESITAAQTFCVSNAS